MYKDMLCNPLLVRKISSFNSSPPGASELSWIGYRMDRDQGCRWWDVNLLHESMVVDYYALPILIDWLWQPLYLLTPSVCPPRGDAVAATAASVQAINRDSPPRPYYGAWRLLQPTSRTTYLKTTIGYLEANTKTKVVYIQSLGDCYILQAEKYFARTLVRHESDMNYSKATNMNLQLSSCHNEYLR